MSTLEKKLYKDINVKGTNGQVDYGVSSKTYKGFSTVEPDQVGFNLYDFQLIKQDIINHFHIRQGELLSNPNFGTIIWDLLYEPLTDRLKDIIIQDVTEIINYDPRVTATSITIDQFDSGIQIEAEIVYLTYNIVEQMRFTFDQSSGFLSA